MKVLRTGLAATVLAGALSFGMVTQAQAVAPIAPILIGGVPVAGEAAIAAGATCAGALPVCLGVAGVLIAGTALYATQDTWVPALSRAFGVAGTQAFPPDASTVGLSTDIVMDSIWQSTPNSVTVSTIKTGPGNAAFGYGYELVCRTSGGVFTWQTGAHSTGLIGTGGGASNPEWKTITCNAGATPVALRTIDRGAGTGSLSRPINYLSWGSSSNMPSDTATTYKATSKCVLPDGSTQDLTVTYSGQADPSDIGFKVPSCAAAGLGNHAKSVTVDAKFPGRTDFRRAWEVTPAAEAPYPLCDPALPGSCVLEVYIDGAACVVGAEGCLDWASQPTSRVQCHYGPYTVARSRCYLLERSYRPGGARLTEPNTDGNPATTSDPAPDPTPTPTPTPTGTGGPTPTPSPTPTPPPGTGTAGPVPVDDPCWPSGSAAWNPAAWVLAPVKCALTWAFVPEAGLSPYTSRITDAWGGSDVGTWVGDVGGSAGTIGGGVSGIGGCSGPVWTINLGGHPYRFAPLDACNEPLRSIAPFVKIAVTALVLIVGFKAVTRAITRSLDLPSAPGS